MEATRSAVIRSAALLSVKAGAFFFTGSAVLLAGMVDSVVDLIASVIAHIVKPRSHHEEHQLALVQNAWIFFGGLLVVIETMKHLSEPVEMASVGIGMLLLTIVVDGTIIHKLRKETNPVIKGLREDIMADVYSSIGGITALTLIALGAPMIADKVIAITIAVALMVKGAKLFLENMEEASRDHEAEHHGVKHEVEGGNEPYV